MAMHDPLNKMVMEEIGLTIDKNKVVIDQDTRQPIIIKDKVMKYSSKNIVPVRRDEQVFDPAANKSQMAFAFDYFVSKLESEGEPVDMYYDIHDGSAMEVKKNGEVLQTEDYNNDQLRYIDMMRRLNGSSPEDIKSMDDKTKKSQVKRKKKPKVDFNK